MPPSSTIARAFSIRPWTTHNGRVVKLIGDGTLVEFGSVVDAVKCALAIQRAVRLRRTLDHEDIVLRIGVNLGDVIIDGDDIYGDGVNVAARLEPLAEPGGVCVASIVNESVGSADRHFLQGRRRSDGQEYRPADPSVEMASRAVIRCRRARPPLARSEESPSERTFDRGAALQQHVGRSGAGILLRRHHRRHHHRPLQGRRPDGDRAQFQLRLQGQEPSTSAPSGASSA